MSNPSPQKVASTPTPAEEDLYKHWDMFCDADRFDGCEDFSERMERAGYCELVPVDDEALEEAFAAERGIERGGNMWQLTTAGHQVFEITRAKAGKT